MATGTVKWFNRDQGVWIYSTRQRRQRCIRAHLSVERAGLSSLNEGAKVSYEEMENRGKSSAENLRVGETPAAKPPVTPGGLSLAFCLRTATLG